MRKIYVGWFCLIFVILNPMGPSHQSIRRQSQIPPLGENLHQLITELAGYNSTESLQNKLNALPLDWINEIKDHFDADIKSYTIKECSKLHNMTCNNTPHNDFIRSLKNNRYSFFDTQDQKVLYSFRFLPVKDPWGGFITPRIAHTHGGQNLIAVYHSPSYGELEIKRINKDGIKSVAIMAADAYKEPIVFDPQENYIAYGHYAEEHFIIIRSIKTNKCTYVHLNEWKRFPKVMTWAEGKIVIEDSRGSYEFQHPLSRKIQEYLDVKQQGKE